MPLATLTIQAIDAALERDQGALYRKHLRRLMPLAEDAYSEQQSDFRSHLGASIIGRDCTRAIWYSFRWFAKERFGGRMLRLFNRGHLEEPRFIALLLTIGCQVWSTDPATGKQFRVSTHGGHFGGSSDSVALGVPDMPGEPMLCEFKTHRAKSFDKLVKEGVRQSKGEHFAQMQTYMRGLGLRYALYLATNKDDDDLYGEIIAFEGEQAERFQDRAAHILMSRRPPARVSDSPSWYACKMCSFTAVCHANAPPERNCRTCVHAELVDGGWCCGKSGNRLSTKEQKQACELYERIP